MPPNVNFFELENCLESLVHFVEKHSKKRYVSEYGPGALKALEQLRLHTEKTDRTYTKWRLELGEGRLALKTLQRTYKRAQRALADAGAIDYPQEVISYWEPDETVDGVKTMLDYLKEHRENLDFAEDFITDLSNLLEGAGKEGEEADKAFDSYKRISGTRKLAMEDAISAIDVLRRRIRDDLGRDHADYRAIRWPAMVAPDPF